MKQDKSLNDLDFSALEQRILSMDPIPLLVGGTTTGRLHENQTYCTGKGVLTKFPTPPTKGNEDGTPEERR